MRGTWWSKDGGGRPPAEAASSGAEVGKRRSLARYPHLSSAFPFEWFRRTGTAFLLLLAAALATGCGPAAESRSATGPASAGPAAETPAAQDATSDDAGQFAPVADPDSSASDAAAAAPSAPGNAARQTPAGPAQLPPESWEAQFIGPTKVGHTHFTAERIEQRGETLWRLRSTMELKLQRFGQSVTQQMEYTSVETPAGQLRECLVEIRGAGAAKRIEGECDGRELRLRITTQGKTEQTRIPWKPEWGGFFAAELSLLKQPLQPGETRKVSSFAPLFNEVSEMEMKAIDYETTELLGGSERLLRVESTTRLGANEIREIQWLDAQGRKQKSRLAMGPGIDLISYRTTRQVALREGGPAEFDLGDASIAKVNQPLAQPHTHRRIVYRARLREGKIRGVFVSEGSQQVQVLDDATAEVTVRAVRPNEPPELAEPGAEPVAADSEPNGLIQSDDPAVVAMASQVAAEETDPWNLARALERHVHEAIQQKNFSQAFATAAEVCRSLEGDCTEHAVLLAALCRARGIPARVAIGLVYYPQAQGFAYHMWNEVWIRDRWVPLDATLGRGGIGGAHLKLVQSNLKGANAYSAFLPVFEVLGNLELEVVEVE